MYQVRYVDKGVNVLMGRCKTQAEAETYVNIEYTQIEMAETRGRLYIKKEKSKPI